MSTGIWITDGIMLLIFIVGLILVIRSRRKKARCTGSAVAEIVAYTETANHDEEGKRSGTTYTPVLEFEAGGYQDAKGHYVRKMVHKSGGYSVSNLKKIKIGSKKKVFFNPDKPEEFYVKGHGGTAGWALMFFSLLTAVIVTVSFLR